MKFPTTRPAAVLNAVLDSGINFIDTAVCYGTSEARIGRAISHRRGEFVLGDQMRLPAGQADGRAEYPYRCKHPGGVEHSLRMMRTDYLDVVQFHQSLTHTMWKWRVALEELLRLKGEVSFVSSAVRNPAESR